MFTLHVSAVKSREIESEGKENNAGHFPSFLVKKFNFALAFYNTCMSVSRYTLVEISHECMFSQCNPTIVLVS